MPRNKYLNMASFLTGDINRVQRCNGRDPASFSISICTCYKK